MIKKDQLILQKFIKKLFGKLAEISQLVWNDFRNG